jgi:hypothetical protein
MAGEVSLTGQDLLNSQEDLYLKQDIGQINLIEGN